MALTIEHLLGVNFPAKSRINADTAFMELIVNCRELNLSPAQSS